MMDNIVESMYLRWPGTHKNWCIFGKTHTHFAADRTTTSIGDAIMTTLAEHYGVKQAADPTQLIIVLKRLTILNFVRVYIVFFGFIMVLIYTYNGPHSFFLALDSFIIAFGLVVIAWSAIMFQRYPVWQTINHHQKKPWSLIVCIGVLVTLYGEVMLTNHFSDYYIENVDIDLVVLGCVIMASGLFTSTLGAILHFRDPACCGRKDNTTRSVDAKQHLVVIDESINTQLASGTATVVYNNVPMYNSGVSTYNNAPKYTPRMVYNNASMYASEEESNNVYHINDPADYPHVFGQSNQNIAAVHTTSKPPAYSMV